MERRKKIALYGGTFDPVHLGHLEVAKAVIQLFEIDEVLFVPAQVAPHKLSRPVTPALHRYAMLALATQDTSRFKISTFEIEDSGRCYTVDTVTHFKSELRESGELFFIMGADSWSEITSWHEWESLLTMINYIVVTRPGYDLDLKPTPSPVWSRIVDLRGLNQERIEQLLHESEGERIFITDAVMKDISATGIRRAARENSARLESMVSPSVANYIKKYRLYRDLNET